MKDSQRNSVQLFKIYVELERARLTHALAIIKEEEGDVSGAATVMLELQVFTRAHMCKNNDWGGRD